MPIGDITPVLSLTIGAALTLVVGIFIGRDRQWYCCLISLATLLTALVFTGHLQTAVPEKLSFSGTWAVDDLTAWCSYIILLSTALVIMLCPVWFKGDRRHGEVYVMLLFGALGALLMVGAADLMELMVAMLLSSVTGYTLASYHRASRMCAEAGAKYYFLGALANPMMFLGIVLLYGVAADTSYSALAPQLRSADADPLLLAAGFGLILTGLAYKLGAVPGHPWVPDVAQASPAPAAAFLTVVPKIGALAALFRLTALAPENLQYLRWAVAIMAVATMTLGNLAALWQKDVRRLLGWSSVSQAGYGLMAVVVAGEVALARSALILFLVGYALANLTAFAVVISLRGRTALKDYNGLFRSRPWHAVSLTIALLSLIGIPPLIGFTAKLALFGAVLEAGVTWLAFVAVINTVVSIFYYLRVIGAMYLGSPEKEAALLSRTARMTSIAAAISLLVLGLAAQVIFGSDIAIVTSGM